MTIALCSSGRSSRQILKVCLLNTPSIWEMHSFEKTVFDKYLECQSGCAQQCSANCKHISFSPSIKASKLCSLYRIGKGPAREMRYTVEEESSSMHAALRIRRKEPPLKSSLTCSTFFLLVRGQAFPLQWARFPVSTEDRSHLRIPKRYGGDSRTVRQTHRWLNVMDCVLW